jgi:SpoVK/Ycf46/Vps4 family AAA+-type ATPase
MVVGATSLLGTRLFFMTTNHIEKLDPALIRPGRCDVKVELRRSSKKQMKEIFLVRCWRRLTAALHACGRHARVRCDV